MPGEKTIEEEPLLEDNNYEAGITLTFHSKERIRRKQRVRFCLALVVGVFILAALIVALYFVSTLSVPEKTTGKYKHAAVASDVGECSEIGRDMLQKGGNAVDGAIATLLCMSVADPQSMGIGGGFFMTIYNRTTRKAAIVDAREVAPGGATEDMFEKDPHKSQRGGLSVAVPGEIKGYWTAHQDHGVLPWKDLFQPAIRMCLDGFPVPESLAEALVTQKTDIFKDKQLKEAFVNPETGELYAEGEILKDEKLGKTLQAIAEGNEATFYSGTLADDIVADLKERDSIITKDDLMNYKALRKTPLEVEMSDGLRIFSPPPPSSGAVLSFIMNILDGYHFRPGDDDNLEGATLTHHRIVEAFKFAYAKRTDLADEDFVNVKDLVKNLTSRSYADHIRTLIWDNQTHDMMYYGPTFYDRMLPSTSHLSVVDADGHAVSVTTTVNLRFGSLIRGKRTGIIFNDEMDDFSSPNITNAFGIPPSPANFIKPGKRPLSSMCPAIFVDGHDDVKLVVGAAGGSHITTATSYVAVRHLWLGDSIKESISHRRLHHQLLPQYISFEKFFDKGIIDGLREKGHNITINEKPGSSIVQGIARAENFLYANSDFRKGGYPAGY